MGAVFAEEDGRGGRGGGGGSDHLEDELETPCRNLILAFPERVIVNKHYKLFPKCPPKFWGC